MKKIVSIALALVLAVSMAACSKNPTETTGPASDAPVATAPVEKLPASALEVLEKTWAVYAEDEKFPVIGGSIANPTDNAPGAFDLADENISFNLLIPAEQLGNVTEAASMIHMMNANTFTGSAFKLAEGVKAADFANAMREAIVNNQWMCGFPETLLISTLGDNYVAVAFGAADLVSVFANHLSAANAGFQTLIDEPLM